jgi:hypothetical protein
MSFTEEELIQHRIAERERQGALDKYVRWVKKIV